MTHFLFQLAYHEHLQCKNYKQVKPIFSGGLNLPASYFSLH